jgi:hypothetical protein
MPQAADLPPRLQQALLLDWDAPELRGPLFVAPGGAARKKLTDLVGPRSDDAVTWSVFRTLQRLPAAVWLPPVLGAPAEDSGWEPASFTYWLQLPPSTERLLWLLGHLDGLAFADPRQAAAAAARLQRVQAAHERWQTQIRAGLARGDGVLEPPFDAGVVITTPENVVVVLGLYRRDIELRTAWDPQRDALSRGLDAALDLAGEGRTPWLLLATDGYRHEGPDLRAFSYEALAPRYRDDPAFLAAMLPHRRAPDLARLASRLRWLSWADLLDAVLDRSAALNAEHRLLLRHLVDYLKTKRLLFKGG